MNRLIYLNADGTARSTRSQDDKNAPDDLAERIKQAVVILEINDYSGEVEVILNRYKEDSDSNS